MAICAWCDQEMTTAASCTERVLHIAGVAHLLIPNGSEKRYGWPALTGRCGDCGAAQGGYHHPGCDLAECPTCGGQLFICSCPFDEHRSDEDEDDGW
jgi:hypothetical protein